MDLSSLGNRNGESNLPKYLFSSTCTSLPPSPYAGDLYSNSCGWLLFTITYFQTLPQTVESDIKRQNSKICNKHDNVAACSCCEKSTL